METTAFHAPASRLPGLDLIRAVAITWVMIYHGSLFGLTSQDHWLVRFGWMGVDLFFVLSGFLIAGQLLRPWARGATPSYARFFGRRLLRTLPAYLVVVALYFLVPGVRDRADLAPSWQFLTFSENWLVDMSTPKAFSHVWSLCVEEQFYLVFPIVVALIALRPTSAKIIGAVVSVMVLGMALRGYLWLHSVAATPFDITAAPRSGPYMRLIYYPTGTRLDGLLMGIAAAGDSVRSAPRLGPGSPHVRICCSAPGCWASSLRASSSTPRSRGSGPRFLVFRSCRSALCWSSWPAARAAP